MRVGSLFSGIAGLDLGLEQAGMTIAWQCEINPQARSILRRHYPNVPCYEDVTTLKGSDVSPIDLLVAGSPCTDLSISGRRAGLDGSQSALFYHFVRLLGEIQPQWFIWENVAGALSSHGGRDMGKALRLLAECGYGFSHRILCASALGVPQRRRRVIVVGHIGDPIGAAEVLLECEGSSWHPQESRRPTSVVAALTATGVGTCGADDNQAQAGHFISTLQSSQTGRWSAEGAAGGQLIPEIEHSPIEALGFGDVSHCLSTRSVRFDPNGETYVAESKSEALATEIVPISFHLTQTPITSEDHFPAMGAGNQTGCATMGVMAPIPIDLRNATRADNSTGLGTPGTGIGKAGDPSYSVTPSPSPAVAFSENQRAEVIEHPVAHQLTSGGGKPGQGYAAVRQDMAVRRLTPVECERLMALPDDWTAFGVNEAGKTVSIPDTHRYRCIGNSVAVPMAAWVARRMMRVERMSEAHPNSGLAA